MMLRMDGESKRERFGKGKRGENEEGDRRRKEEDGYDVCNLYCVL